MPNFCYIFVKYLVLTLFKIIYRIKIYGPRDHRGPAIIAPNHTSHFDPMIATVCWPEPVHTFGRENLYTGKLGLLINRLNSHPINRDETDLSAMKKMFKLLEKGKKMLLFPEGRRSDDGQLQPLQPGVAMLSIRSGCPIIPAHIEGPFDLWPRGQSKPKLRGRMSITWGEPIDPKEYAHLKPKEARAALTERLANDLKKLRPR